ncbi:hypothetical protein WMY93_016221 [Mugilogobius chulae]|uniref:Transposase n=1 Tax=Mugilogobius chulae TaxID=88201 RepID=A0AAW0NSG2_9GOBI
MTQANFSPDSQEPTEEAYLRSGRPHQGLHLTASRHAPRLHWDNVHVRWTLARWRTVLFSDCTMLMAESVFGTVLVSVMLRLLSCDGGSWGGSVMVWAGICHGHCTRLHFINANLNAQRYRDEILRPIVASFVELHHVTFQQDNARPHIARICRDFLEEEDILVLN